MNVYVKSIVLTAMLSLSGAAGAFGSGPHKAYGRLVYENGAAPASVSFTAYILGRPADVLSQNDFDCGYENGTWFVQCGNFSTDWSLWDVLHVDFSDGAGKAGSIEVPLTADAGDNAGTTTLTAENHTIKLSIGDISGARGTTVQVPVALAGLSQADSVVAYNLTLQFDPDVLAGVGGSSTGTMTRNWGDPYAGPRSDEMTLAGFTANDPGSRMVNTSGILVNALLMIHGIPASQTSNASLVRLKSAVIYTLSSTYVISRTRTGVLRVITDGTQVSRTITLKPFWNLLSLGISPDPNTIPEVIEGLNVSYISGYLAGEGPRSWDINRPSFLNDLLILDGLHGYWFKSTAQTDQNWSFSGVALDVSTPLSLYQGWNLVSYLPRTGDVLSHALSALGSGYTYIIGYDGTNTQDWDINRPDFLNTLTHMRPSFGYWIKMSTSGRLVYPASGYSPPKVYAGTDSTDVQGAASTTFCDFYAVQPGFLTPGDTIRAYDPDNVLCGDTLVGAEGGFLLHVTGDDFTTSDVDEGAVDGDTICFTVNGRSAIVTSGDNTWTDKASKEITLGWADTGADAGDTEVAPAGFSLGRNYPNPFNGQTVIGFTIAIPAGVSLTVFDSMGRPVKTLFLQENCAPGRYRVTWDGSGRQGTKVPSGLYFYRLRAGSETKVNKMVLLN